MNCKLVSRLRPKPPPKNYHDLCSLERWVNWECSKFLRATGSLYRVLRWRKPQPRWRRAHRRSCEARSWGGSSWRRWRTPRCLTWTTASRSLSDSTIWNRKTRIRACFKIKQIHFRSQRTQSIISCCQGPVCVWF